MNLVALTALFVVAQLSGAFCANHGGCASPQKGFSAEAATSFAQESFDYLIIGAGPAGLAIATRLSEDPGVAVGVIEAGVLHLNDPKIDIPQNNGEAAGNSSYDWRYASVPQVHANGTVIVYPRGKLVGGSTALNNMAWLRASKEEYDAWGSLSGSNQWSWDGLVSFFHKAEHFQAKEGFDPFPTISGIAPTPLSVSVHGRVPVSHQAIYPDPVASFVKTFNNIGAPTNLNPFDGNSAGVCNALFSIDREKGVRAYAATTYYADAQCRPNFRVLTGAQATKILFEDNSTSTSDLVAQSVEFMVNNVTYTANARKEIIVSGGVFNTPQILELSGIGNATLLRELGIRPLIDLPGVGENLQDHLFIPLQYELKPNVKTFDQFRINASFAADQAAQYASNHTGWLVAVDSTAVFLPFQKHIADKDISSLLGSIDAAMSKNNTTPLQKEQYALQKRWIQDGKVPQSETVLFSRGTVNVAANTSYITVLTSVQHPFSRGSVHITSTDPLVKPSVDTNALSSNIDLFIFLQLTKLVQRLSQNQPINNEIAAPSFPGVNLTEAATVQFIKQSIITGSHPMGTAPMAKRELGGVVDGNLKVYGTKNLRVADASIIPLAIATHLQASVYAIGEKVADLIRQSK